MIETKVRQQYDRLAEIYDRRWDHYISDTLSFLKTWANLSSSATLLDIGCGTGEFERLILAECPTQQMVGVDISEEMLAIARQKLYDYANVSFQLASASVLPFTDHSFDVIVSASSFHYFDNPIAALTEMQRVVKPSGQVIILDWCKDFILCRLCDVLLHLIDPAYQQCYTQAAFHQLLTDAGFDICRTRRVRFGLVWGLMIATATPKI